MNINKREREVLRYAVVQRWDIEFDTKDRGWWDGDHTMPFRGHSSFASLIAKGLMTKESSGYGFCYGRATVEARKFQCRAEGCQKGQLYEYDGHSYDREVGKCKECEGTGLLLSPKATP